MSENLLRRTRTFGAVLGASLIAPLLLAAPASAAPNTVPGAAPAAASGYDPNLPGPRVVITTDGEGDDQASMHRALLYADQLDIEVIASSSSRWHWAGDPNATPPIAPHRWSGDDGGHDWIPELIDNGYRAVYPNLIVHDPGFPEPDELLSKVYNGNITNQGEMTKDTPGSLAIKSVLLDDDPRPVSLQAWGGTNTIAAALRSIKDEFDESPEWASIQKKVYDKAQLYIIQDQDVTYKEYIAIEWPGLTTVMNRDQFEAFAYSWADQNPEPFIGYFQKDWVTANLKSGPLMESYPLNESTGHWFSEGDTPAFLHAVPTGLGQFENPAFGGWGGRFEQVSENVWADDPRYLGFDADAAHDCQADLPLIQLTLDAPATAGSSEVTLSDRRVGGGVHGQAQIFAGDIVKIGNGAAAETRTVAATQLATRPYTVTLDQPLAQSYASGAPFADYCSTFWPQARFAEDIQLDFAARAAWTITSDYDDANHAPEASVAEGVSISAKAGEPVSLQGTATDPDGDAVTYNWWRYAEADTYDGAVTLDAAETGTVSFTVPEDAQPGSTIHLIVEAKDDGTPTLKHWQRVVVTVVDAHTPTVDTVSSAASTTGATSVTVTGSELFDVTAVSIGGVEVAADAAADGRSLTFTAPVSEVAGAVAASLVGADGASFEIEYAAPTVNALTPARGPSTGGQELVLSGTDLALAEDILFGDEPGADATASADAVTVTSPEGADGNVDVTVVLPGLDVVLEDAYAFTTVKVAVGEGSVQAGGELGVVANGLGAGELAEIWLHSEPVLLEAVAADDSGAVEARVTIPAGTDAGDHEVVVRAADSGTGAAAITVTAGSSGTGGGSGDDLATTGGGVPWGVALGGLALLLLGAAGAFAARRRSITID